MDLSLAVTGIVFAVLFILFRVIRHRSSLNGVDLFFAFAAVLLLLSGLIVGHLNAETDPRLHTLVLATAAVMLVPGVIVSIIQAVRGQLGHSSGLFMVGMGTLLITARFFVPLAADYFEVTAKPELISPLLTITPLTRSTDLPTMTVFAPTALNRSTSTPTPISRIERTAIPSITPRPSRTRYASPTPSETPTLPSPCVVVALYNVNMRAEPDVQASLVMTIPYQTAVSAYGRNDDRTWWFVEYEGAAGWVSDEFVSVTSSCSQLPVRR